ncbi:hypothetical protein P3T37_000853 [Kitasatospora sp. MAA4]|uniref:hypothetical protein n=1 Tax=Kitasatospora sp. MAA4 TaxID=3035093 RepID=UPI002476A158|nr:hypothetical protein [Kitasatospora sp. MAA4]MDH6131484.1 hypothetical protein [Kitasatospora sp. MAA4]
MDKLLTILLELESSTEVLGADEVDIGARVRWVHAADASQAPPPRTLCGLDATVLDEEAYRPASPEDPWYPPAHATRRCPACDAALRSTPAQ